MSKLPTWALFASVIFSVASPAQAVNSEMYQLHLGPQIGGGTVSTNQTVRHSSGYSISLFRPWFLSHQTIVGPWFGVGNTFISTTGTTAGSKYNMTYDNRVIFAGLRYERDSKSFGPDMGLLFASAGIGKAYSKVEVDRSSDAAYTQMLINGVQGTTYQGEIGSRITLKDSLGISISVLSEMYRLKQNKVSGTFQEDRIVDGKLELLEGSYDQETGEIPDHVVMKTLGIRFALTLGF